MKSKQYLRHAGWLSIVLGLTACGGGGGSGGGPGPTDSSGGTTPSTIRIAGAALTVPAQAGQAAEAAPDGAQVELVSVSGSTPKTVATTTVKAGRFQFDGQSVTLGATTLVQLNVGGTVYRAPAFANEVEVSPHSEAVLSTVDAEKFRSGAINAQEYDVLLQGSRWLGELARIDPATTGAALSPANLKRLAAGDTAYAAYLTAAEQDSGSTAETMGDVGNLMPVATGMRWQYRDQGGNVLPLIATGAAGSRTFTVMQQITKGTVRDLTRKADGIYGTSSLELRGANGTVQIPLGEQPFIPFPAKLGLSRESTVPAVLVVPDIDGDRKPESVSVTWSLQVQAVEAQTVLGVSTPTLRIVRKLSAKLTLSSDQSVGTLQTDETYWLAPGIGLVRARSASVIEHPLLRANLNSEQTLFAFGSDATGPLRFDGGAMQQVPLSFSSLVMDLPRRRLLAALNGDELGKGHSLAAINIDTGDVSYSPASLGAIDTLAVAPTGEVFAAISTGDPNGFGCASTGTIVRMGATTLQEEARYSPAKGRDAYCVPGKVMFMQALSAGTLIVQARQSPSSELMRLDDGVRAPNDFSRYYGGDVLLSSPMRKAFVSGGYIYLVDGGGNPLRAAFDTSGFGRPELLLATLGSGQLPWMAGNKIRAGFQEFDISTGAGATSALNGNYCGLQEVPGHADWAACGSVQAYYLGDFAIYDWATGRPVTTVSLPWVPETWSATLDQGLVFDEWTVVYGARVFGSSFTESRHNGLYIARRTRP